MNSVNKVYPEFALMTFYYPTERDNYQELAELTLPNRDAYCKKHDYAHFTHCGPYQDPSKYYAIQRLYLLYDLMNRYSYIKYFWILNIQSYIMNSTVKLESFVDEEHDFYIHKDVNNVNAGSFIVKNSEWGRKWIKFVMDEAPNANHCWHENWIFNP